MSRTRIVVHTSTFAKARQLGNQMADDPQIRPHLKNLAQYSGYFRFRLAHRAHLEATPRFEHYYLEKVYALADREVKLQRIPRTDAVESWDRWYHLYVHPI